MLYISSNKKSSIALAITEKVETTPPRTNHTLLQKQ